MKTQLQATEGQQINEALIQLSEAAQQTAEWLQQANLAIEQINEAPAVGCRMGPHAPTTRLRVPVRWLDFLKTGSGRGAI